MSDMTKQEALDKIDELKKYVKEFDKKKNTSKTKLEIKTLGGSVLWKSEKLTIKEALIEAVDEGADLEGADLEGADLRGADLRGADLEGADLYNAKFYGRGGNTKIKKSQINDFLEALGIVLEE